MFDILEDVLGYLGVSALLAAVFAVAWHRHGRGSWGAYRKRSTPLVRLVGVYRVDCPVPWQAPQTIVGVAAASIALRMRHDTMSSGWMLNRLGTSLRNASRTSVSFSPSMAMRASCSLSPDSHMCVAVSIESTLL